MCANMAKIGRFKQFQRTPGVSTTDITQKLLAVALSKEKADSMLKVKPGIPKQLFLQTAHRIRNFANTHQPKATDSIVYYSASCDLMHPGVVERIKKAKAFGDFLYIGLWDDKTVQYLKGGDARFPIVTM